MIVNPNQPGCTFPSKSLAGVGVIFYIMLALRAELRTRNWFAQRAEVNLAAQDIPELGIGSGIDNIELGLRLRYEIAREFAPYVGIEQEWKLGGSRDFARAAGEDASVTNYVVGVRFWF